MNSRIQHSVLATLLISVLVHAHPVSESDLVSLASARFGRSEKADGSPQLHEEADIKLFTAIAAGIPADFRDVNPNQNDLANSDPWGTERTIDADRIVWACTDPIASKSISNRGITIIGAQIRGQLDLKHVRMPFPIALWGCRISETIDLTMSEVRALSLDGSHTVGLTGDGLQVETSLYLRRGFVARGEIRLIGAQINGILDCSAGNFGVTKGNSINADLIRVGGGVILGGVDGVPFESFGTISFKRARIGNDLTSKNARFSNQGGIAFVADGCELEGGLFITSDHGRATEINGEFRVNQARIRNGIEFIGTLFRNKQKDCLIADGVKCDGNVVLTSSDDAPLQADGRISFLGAVINGNLSLKGVTLENANGKVFTADGAQIQGAVFLTSFRGLRFKSVGEVSFRECAIGGTFMCSSAILENVGGRCLDAGFAIFSANVFLGREDQPLETVGESCFIGTTVKGNISLSDCVLAAVSGKALNLEGVHIGGNLSAEENVQVNGGLHLLASKIDRHFLWKAPKTITSGIVDLRSSEIGILCDHPASWPNEGELLLNGLRYQEFCTASPKDSANRIKWIQLQPDEQYYAQPYSQLASVLRNEGREDEAQVILIAKEDDPSLLRGFSATEQFLHSKLGSLIGYGYAPGRVLPYIMGWIGVGWLLFQLGNYCGIMTPTSDRAYENPGNLFRKIKSDYPRFNSLVYSIDEFAPIINLRQGDHWIPNVNSSCRSIDGLWGKIVRCFGRFLRAYLWAHILAGWVLCTLGLAGLTGLLRG